jgi:spore germination cell wall hydrolase CwlJ-like protein
MVVQVVINRKNHLKKFGRTYCEVIREPYQFSWTLDIGKAYMLEAKQPLTPKDFKKYSKVVLDVLENQHKVLDKDKEILYYHSTAVKPKWSKKMTLVYRIGNHLFYKED